MKKNIFLWSLYDFANSIVMIVFLFYFSQWLVVDSGKPDWWYNATLVISSVLFILTAPVAGQILDSTNRKLFGLRVTTGLTTIFFLVTALITLFAPQMVLLATTLYTLAFYFYLMCFVYYTPMVRDLSDGNNRGWISGLGQGVNSIGQVCGLLITLPFATGAWYLFGAPGRAQTLLPAVILFAIMALPMMCWYKDNFILKISDKLNIANEYKKILITIKKIFSVRNLALLLIAYFLFSDALLTFSNNFPIFLERVFGASDSIKTYLSAGILLLSGIGSMIFGKIADKKGSKPTLKLLLICWVILFPAIAFSPSLSIEAVVCLIAGVLYGPVWGVSRSMVAEYTPKEISASAFSFYTIAERFATFIGPIVWSTILITTESQGPLSYSYAIVSLGALTLLGLWIINKIRPSNVA